MLTTVQVELPLFVVIAVRTTANGLMGTELRTWTRAVGRWKLVLGFSTVSVYRRVFEEKGHRLVTVKANQTHLQKLVSQMPVPPTWE